MQTDLFGELWGHNRSWSNATGYSKNINGNGWAIAQLPWIAPFSETNGPSGFYLVENALEARFYNSDGHGGFYPRHFDMSDLTYDNNSSRFIVTDGAGSQLAFADYSTNWNAGQRGSFLSKTDPGGNVTYVSAWKSNGRPGEVTHSDGTNTVAFVYTYTSSDGSGYLQNVKMQQKVGTGSWTTARQADYEYYTNGNAGGGNGDLKFASIKDSVGNVIDTAFYRYYVSGQSGGYDHGLKFAFSGDSYARLVGAYPSTPVDLLTDAQIAPFADNSFAYDSSRRVIEEFAQGAGCCNGGLGEFAMSYTASSNPAGYNSWAMKTEVTLPDGNVETVYTNAYGQVMLFVHQIAATETKWGTYYRYDDEGRAILIADTSAIDLSNELSAYQAHADLMNLSGGDFVYLKDSGLITTYEFSDTTTAGPSAAGDVDGFLKSVSIRNGESGNAVRQVSYQYIAFAAGADTVYLPASSTVYRNDDGTGAITTTHAYTMHSGTAQIASQTTTYPLIDVSENGDNSSNVETALFDINGRLTWFKDADGYIHYRAHDQMTGALTVSITDVEDSTLTVPSGWSTPTTGGLHLATQFEVDKLGRATKTTDANGHVTYVVYKDVEHEVRTYVGWDTTTDRPTGPTLISRANRGDTDGTNFHGFTENLTTADAPEVVNDRPTGNETITLANMRSLSRVYVNSAAQPVANDLYTTLVGLTAYPTAASPGIAGTHFLRTMMAYDSRGRLARAVAPDGSIRRTVFDSLGRIASEWVGGAGDDGVDPTEWTPSDPVDMLKIREYLYDGGGIGDGNLTTLTEFPGDPAPNMRTDYRYDWRNRLIAEKSGVEANESYADADLVDRPITVYSYDNLDQPTRVEVYDGDGRPLDEPGGRLRARTDTAYDAEGKVYRVTQVGVIQTTTTSALSGTAFAWNTFYDGRGNVVASVDPLNHPVTYVYDGAGRQTSITVSLSATETATTHTEYDGVGNVITTVDGLGNEIAYVFDRADRLTTTVVEVSANVNATSTINYDDAGRIDSTIDPNSNSTTYIYDLAGRTLTITNATNEENNYAFNDDGYLATVTDGRGAVTAYGYDERGRMVSTTNALGDSWLTGYDNLDRVISSTDPLGNETGTTFDVVGRVVAVIDPLGRSSTTRYNALGQVIVRLTPTTTNSANDLVSTTTYDSFGRVASVHDGVGTTTFGYDAASRRTSLTDPVGNVTTFAFDWAGRLTAQTDPRGETTTFEYDDANRRIETVDRNDRRREMFYDFAGRQTGELWYDDEDNLVETLSFTYDAAGNQLTATNSAGTQSFEYDELNRVEFVSQISGIDLEYTYDAAGNRIMVEDSLGGLEVSIYDLAGQLRRRAQGPDDWVDFHYDAAGRQTSIVRYHDDNGPPQSSDGPRIIGMTVNGGPTDALDLYGNAPYLFGQQSVVVQILVTFDQAVTLDEDEAFTLENLAGDVTSSGTGPSTDEVLVHAEVVPGSGGTQYVLTFADDPSDAGSGVWEIDNTIDGGEGSVFTILKAGLYRLHAHGDEIVGSGGTMEDDPDYVFWTLYGAVDSSDYLVGPTAPGGSIVNINASLIGFTRSFGAESEGSAWPYYNAGFDWNLDGSINDDITPFGANYGTEWTWSNTVYAASSLVAFTATSYDAAGRIVRQMSSDANAAGLVDYRATYDFAGQVTSRSENGVTRTFAYDAAGQVIGETVPNFVAQTFETTEYDYDDAGNRQAVNRPGTSNDRSYTMDVGSGSTPHANRYLSDGVWTFEYDDEGNLRAKDRIASAERWEYTYDHRNHLVRAEHTTNGTAIDKWVEYVDDAHGNRVARIADLDGVGNGGASTVRYTLDGFNPSKPVPIGLENFDVWSENAADVSSSLITRYMHGDGVDELLGRWDAVGAGSGQFWILSDSLGSVRGVVEVGGTLVNQLTYDAFGTIVAETNPTYRGNFAFTGRFFDAALGLQTNGDRIYDPDLGRWLQTDPIGFAAGDGNLYRYVGNGATNATDPSGFAVAPPPGLGNAATAIAALAGGGNPLSAAAAVAAARRPLHAQLEQSFWGIGRRYIRPVRPGQAPEVPEQSLAIPDSIRGATPVETHENAEIRIAYLQAVLTPSLRNQSADGSPVNNPRPLDPSVRFRLETELERLQQMLPSLRGQATIYHNSISNRAHWSDAQVRLDRQNNSESLSIALTAISLPSVFGVAFRFTTGVLTRIGAGLLERGGRGFLSSSTIRFLFPPVHGNSLAARGIHEVYVLRNAANGQILRFGETGQGYLIRFAQWRRFFERRGIRINGDILRTVEGKLAARAIETRYIRTYKWVFGRLPPYNRTLH